MQGLQGIRGEFDAQGVQGTQASQGVQGSLSNFQGTQGIQGIQGTGGTITITDDTSTNATRYVNFTSGTSGTLSTLNTSSTKLTFNPSTGDFTAGGNITANSDMRIKKNIRTLENSLEKVLALRGVEFDRIDTGQHQIGIIAQEVEKLIPEIVKETNGMKSVAYGNLVAILIEAIKEQNKRIEQLELNANKGD